MILKIKVCDKEVDLAHFLIEKGSNYSMELNGFGNIFVAFGTRQEIQEMFNKGEPK